MGIAGMILGILAMIVVWIPVIGIVAIPMVAAGLPLSLVGLRRARRDNEGAGMAVAGITLNIVAAAVILLWLVAFSASLATFLALD